MNVKYYLRVKDISAEWQEVSQEQFVKAERRAGFYPNWPENGKPCTAGFSDNSVEGMATYSSEVKP